MNRYTYFNLKNHRKENLDIFYQKTKFYSEINNCSYIFKLGTPCIYTYNKSDDEDERPSTS